MACRLLPSFLLFAAFAPSVFAACGNGVQCPESTPCCSQYGDCGVGAYCLGGCDPINSFTLDSCVPAPVCASASYSFDNLDKVVSNTKYLGDASKADWVSSGEPVEYDSQVLLTMAEGTVGTLLASTHYVWYGKVGARFKTSAGAGVVTAFILLSDVKDEIDFEFVGVDLEQAQTNFYWQGVTNYTNGLNASGISDTMQNFHDYEIDWTPEKLTWSIDGDVVRTLNKADTYNTTSKQYSYPQTPARVQLSLWPAGLASNGQGTVNWAGGLVDWSSQYMTNNYYYAIFDSVDVDCYDPPSDANNQGSVSYVYTDTGGYESDVETTNDKTVLKSLLGTGTNMSADYASSASASGAAATSNAATVPGLSGAGPGTNGQRGSDDSSSSSASSGTSATAASSGSASTGFVQGSGGTNGAPATMQPETVLSGSLFAVIIAIVGLCVL